MQFVPQWWRQVWRAIAFECLYQELLSSNVPIRNKLRFLKLAVVFLYHLEQPYAQHNVHTVAP